VKREQLTGERRIGIAPIAGRNAARCIAFVGIVGGGSMSPNRYLVRVDRVILDTDMRRTKSLAFDYPALYRGLKRGHVILFLNRAGTMCRFLDSGRIVHTFWAEKGERFHIGSIVELCNARLLEIGLEIIKGKKLKSNRMRGVSIDRAA